MDIQTVKALAGPEGHELLSALPPYDESTVLSLQGRLREAGTQPFGKRHAASSGKKLPALHTPGTGSCPSRASARSTSS